MERFKVYRHDKNNPASVSSDIVISALEDRSEPVVWYFSGRTKQNAGRKNSNAFYHQNQ
jgi:hypothetical protein